MKSRLALILVLLAFSPLATAHPLHLGDAGFIAGILHPFSGLDHMLAMFAVGLWSSQLGGRALWVVPVAFVGAMVPGGMIGMSGIELPYTEILVALSVLTLGLMISFTARLPTVMGMLLVGLFALFHGQAHGMELPHAAAPMLYCLGFTTATAALHSLGIATGLLMQRRRSSNLVRASHIGMAISAIGALLAM